MKSVVTAAEIQNFLDRGVPHTSLAVDKVEAGNVWVYQTVDESNLRPGRTISGPTMMAMADGAAYVVVIAHIGIVPLAVTSNLNISFLSKPEAGKTLLAQGTLLHLGRRSVITKVDIYSKGQLQKPVAHAVVTYAIPSSHFET